MRKICMSFVLALLILSTIGCGNGIDISVPPEASDTAAPGGTSAEPETYGEEQTIPDVYEGYFEGDESDVSVSLISGTDGCWKLENNILTFSGITENTVCAVSGRLNGRIVADIDDSLKLELELTGFSAVCEDQSAIALNGGKKLTLTAKKGTKNYIYDNRPAVDAEDATAHAAAIWSASDLELSGKGELTVVSENNNGVHAKDDLEVKNLTLSVVCMDNALKGNDGVTLTDAAATLIAKQGDGVKTSNGDVSESGKQRGIVALNGGNYDIYAACDGIDAAYAVTVDGDGTRLNIYTDKYSEYSEAVEKSGGSTDGLNFIRFTSKNYSYSVKYYNSESDYKWVNASYHSTVSGGRSSYYYYSYEKLSGYEKIRFFIYGDGQKQGQEEDFLVSSDYLEYNGDRDTFALTNRGNSLSYEWTDYSSTISDGWGRGPGGGPGGPGGGPGGPGGMSDGNPEKGDHSAKGIKAADTVTLNAGQITVKSYDDAIHAGNVNISGGDLTLYSDDDGVHADGILTVSAGTVDITGSYEGLEGARVLIDGGSVSVIASDDGINSTASTGNGVTISGGSLYIFCNGDGIDANSRTSYEGIIFNGGDVAVISTSSMDSAIDTEQGYAYNGGRVVAVMPSGGMSGEATHCRNFSSVGTSKSVSLSKDAYLTVGSGGSAAAVVKMPTALSSKVIYLGDSSVSVSAERSTDKTLDKNGVWFE